MAGKNTADHLTGHEHSRQALAQSEEAHRHTQAAKTGHSIVVPSHTDIAARAYEIWQAKGRPEGSAQEDWFRAAEELRSQTRTS